MVDLDHYGSYDDVQIHIYAVRTRGQITLHQNVLDNFLSIQQWSHNCMPIAPHCQPQGNGIGWVNQTLEIDPEHQPFRRRNKSVALKFENFCNAHFWAAAKRA